MYIEFSGSYLVNLNIVFKINDLLCLNFNSGTIDNSYYRVYVY